MFTIEIEDGCKAPRKYSRGQKRNGLFSIFCESNGSLFIFVNTPIIAKSPPTPPKKKTNLL